MNDDNAQSGIFLDLSLPLLISLSKNLVYFQLYKEHDQKFAVPEIVKIDTCARKVTKS